MGHFAEAAVHKTKYRPFYRLFFHISLWEKVFLGPSASCDIVITWFSHYKHWLQSLVLFLRATLMTYYYKGFPVRFNRDILPSSTLMSK